MASEELTGSLLLGECTCTGALGLSGPATLKAERLQPLAFSGKLLCPLIHVFVNGKKQMFDLAG